jgi:hypothetical protein
MTRERIDELCKLAYGANRHFDIDVPVKRHELRELLDYVKFAERRHLKKVTRFRRAHEDDFNVEHLRPSFVFDQSDPTIMAYAKKDRVIVFSSAGMLVMQSGIGEAGLFPNSKVTKWIDTQIVDIFNG